MSRIADRPRAPVVGRRVGGGFELDCIIQAQKEEAARYRARLDRAERIRLENAVVQRLSEAATLNSSSPVTQSAGPASPLSASPRHSPAHDSHSEVRSEPPPAPPSPPRLRIPRVRLDRGGSSSGIGVDRSETKESSPCSSPGKQRRKQLCQSLGFPMLWTYPQTPIACEALSRSVSDMAFAHGGDRVFSSPNVLQAFREMNLSCLHDPLLAPMISRIQERHSKRSPTAVKSPQDTGLVDSASREPDDATDDRVGLEQFAIPPSDLKHLDPMHASPIFVPAFDAVETILVFATLSTEAERRGFSKKHQQRSLDALHRRRAAEILSILHPDGIARVAESTLKPKKPKSSEGDIPAEVESDLASAPCAVMVRILFWFVYCSFFHHKLLPSQAAYFVELSKAQLAIELHATSLRNFRLAPNGLASEDRSVSYLQHPDNRSQPLDFLPFVIIHAVCLLFPIVFPASHDVFTVDFFNRASMLMHLMLVGTESDAAYWLALRKQFFAPREISVEEIATAAEVARSESDRLLRSYEDDVAQQRRLKQTQELREAQRLAAQLRQFGDSGPQLTVTESMRQINANRQQRNPNVTQGVSDLYCPPLDTMELGDPVFHLLNDDVYDAEQAQDIIRMRQRRYDSTAATRHAASVRSSIGKRPDNEVMELVREAEEAEALQRQSIFSGHSAAHKLNGHLQLRQRFRPSQYDPDSLVAQAEFERNVSLMLQQQSASHPDEPDENRPLAITNDSSLEGNVEVGRSNGTAPGLVIKFTAKGIACSEVAEQLARSMRSICKSAAVDARKSYRGASPLARPATMSSLSAADRSFFDVELAVLNGPPVVTDAPSLSNVALAASSGKPPLPLLSQRKHTQPSAEDPTIEATLVAAASTPLLGDVMFGGVDAASESLSAGAVTAHIDAEAAAAISGICHSIFGPDNRKPNGRLEAVAPRSHVSERDQEVPGAFPASDATARQGVVGRGAEQLARKLGNGEVKNMPLALRSFFSFKLHEASQFAADQNVLQSPDRCSGDEVPRRARTEEPAPAHSLVALQRAISPSTTVMRSLTAGSSRSASRSLINRVSSPDAVEHNDTSAASATDPQVEGVVPPRLAPKPMAGRAHSGPVSRPNGALLVSLDATDGTPATGAHITARSISRSQKTSAQWLSMTRTVQNTQRYIDDAVRIHNAQVKLKALVEDRTAKEREMGELRQRAMDKTFEDEIHHLNIRIADPIQRSLLVNDWLAREPPTRRPDREKHAAMLRGTILAEEAHHTSLLVKEGLRKLEVTFARRRRQTRKL